MKYVDVINKHRKPTVPDIHRTVSCWAPFQSIHINKRGELKVCPFDFSWIEFIDFQSA